MAKAMTKSQVLKALAEENAVSKKEAAAFVESLVGLAYKEAANGFTIPGLGLQNLGLRHYPAWASWSW